MTDKKEEGERTRLLTFYTVFATKKLREVIDGAIFSRLQEIFEEVKADAPIIVTDWASAPYYLAIVTKVRIMSGLPAVLRKFKKVSDAQIVRDFPELQEKLDGDNFWMAAFCCVPEGPSSEKILEGYIESARRSSKSHSYLSIGG